MSYVHLARHRVDRRNVRLSQEVLRIIVVAGLVRRAIGTLILHLNIIFLLEVVNAGVESLHLSDIFLIHLILILVVVHALILIHTAGEFASELHVGVCLGAWRRPVVEALQRADAAEACRIRELLLVLVHAHLMP